MNAHPMSPLREAHWLAARDWADCRAEDFVRGETSPTERTMLAQSRMEDALTALLNFTVAASPRAAEPPSPNDAEFQRGYDHGLTIRAAELAANQRLLDMAGREIARLREAAAPSVSREQIEALLARESYKMVNGDAGMRATRTPNAEWIRKVDVLALFSPALLPPQEET